MILAICIVVALVFLEPPASYALIVAGAAVEVAETSFWFWYTNRRRATVGVETFVGRIGVASTDLWPEGQVKIDGEIWRARCDGGCDAGMQVVVREVDGLTLVVEPT